jgi:hypothetical protein
MRMTALMTARLFVQEMFPGCCLAVLGGSASRGEDREGSDLDLVVLSCNETERAFRRTYRAHGWVIEVFFLTLDEYRALFDEGIHASNPALQRMLAGGHVLVADGASAHAVLVEAKQDLLDGPMPWTLEQINYVRYMVTEQVEDVRGAGGGAEGWFAVAKLATLLCEFRLRTEGQWIGEGKYLFRCLRDFDPVLAVQLEEALEVYMQRRDAGKLIHCAENVLNPHGGLLFEGFEAWAHG